MSSLRPIRAKKRKIREMRYGRIPVHSMTDIPQEPFRLPELSRKKWAGLAVGLFLVFILGIGNYGPYGPIPVVFGSPDFNTSYSHTRTTIFSDTTLSGLGPGFDANSHSSPQANCSPCTLALAVKQNDLVIAVIFRSFDVGAGISGTTTISDTQSDTFTNLLDQSVNGNMRVLVFSAVASITGSTTLSVTSNGVQSLGGDSYSNVAGTGVQSSVFDNGGTRPTSGTSSVTLTGMSGNERIFETMIYTDFGSCVTLSPASGQTQRDTYCDTPVNFSYRKIVMDLPSVATTATVSINWSGGTNAGSSREMLHYALELKGGTSSPAKIQWNYNSTCVGSPGGEFDFTFKTGIAGKDGNNCNSADILISKAPVNLQTISGRMLEIVYALRLNSTTPTQFSALDLVLRSTNGTLPSFTENYDPFNDTQARLIWTACGPNAQVASLSPIYLPCSTFSTTNKQGVWIARDQTKTIQQETLGNDQIINGTALWPANANVENQLVLNFTGPNNYINSIFTSTTSNSTQNSASNLQIGQDYYILIKAVFGAGNNGIPDSTNNVAFTTSATIGNLPRPFEIFSVPSSCTDPVNKATCSLPTATPVFNFNPLDPSSWGNAIIKGLVWVFTVAVFNGSIAFQVLSSAIVAALNLVGNFFGLGNVGTFMSQLFTGGATLLTNGVSWLVTGSTWIVSLSNDVSQAVTIMIAWAGPLLTFAFNMLVGGVNSIGFVLTILYWTFLGISALFITLEILLFFLLTGDYGGAGIHAWWETTKWFIFGTGVHFLLVIFNFGLDVISAVISVLPKPLIQMSGISRWPRLPTFEVNGSPTLPTGSMEAAREGNIFTMFAWILGIVFTVAYESTTLPGSIAGLVPGAASAVAPLSTLLNLMYVTLFLAGTMLIFLLPAQLANAFPALDKGFGGVPGRKVKLSVRGPPSVSIGAVGVRRGVRKKGRVQRFTERRLEVKKVIKPATRTEEP